MIKTTPFEMFFIMREYMKKIVFGSALMLSGVVGYVGWLIACVHKTAGGSFSRVLSYPQGSDYLVGGLFIALGIIGIAVCVREILKDK